MPQTAEAMASTGVARARLPRQIAYIIGNEGCECFSFYGMRNILTQILVSSALLFTATAAVSQAEREGAAKEVFHTFVLGVYFFPLLGGWLADRFLGKPDWFEPSQMQAINPLLVVLLIPFNNLVLYPAMRQAGIEPTSLRRMGAGIAFSGLSWVAVGAIQLAMDHGHALSIVWQVLPYVLLTLGEVWVSATGLEFAYSQARPQ